MVVWRGSPSAFRGRGGWGGTATGKLLPEESALFRLLEQSSAAKRFFNTEVPHLQVIVLLAVVPPSLSKLATYPIETVLAPLSRTIETKLGEKQKDQLEIASLSIWLFSPPYHSCQVWFSSIIKDSSQDMVPHGLRKFCVFGTIF